MLYRLFVLFLTVPLVELLLLWQIGQWIGWQWTLVLVFATGILGAWLARHEGLRCWGRLQSELRAGRLPGDPLLDALMILVAGAFLITPGVLTDLLGFSLLTPLFRRPLRRWLKARIQVRFDLPTPPGGWTDAANRPYPHDQIIDTQVLDADDDDASDRP